MTTALFQPGDRVILRRFIGGFSKAGLIGIVHQVEPGRPKSLNEPTGYCVIFDLEGGAYELDDMHGPGHYSVHESTLYPPPIIEESPIP